MHVELMIVGAHTGEKQEAAIREAAARGPVVLVEPVPHLHAALAARFADLPSVACLPLAVAAESGPVRFHAPRPSAAGLAAWGDQLGSLLEGHATAHLPDAAAHLEVIDVPALSFADLVAQLGLTSLRTLYTDLEGMDVRLLPTFPFDRVRPDQIVFEYKHADGPRNIGRRLGALLIRLDELGYRMQIADLENCVAVHRDVAPVPRR